MSAASIASDEPLVYGAAIQGAREEQQDSFRIRWLEKEGAWLFVLADGMGGHASGAAASRIAVDAFVATFVSRRAADVSVEDALDDSLRDVNHRIALYQEQDHTSLGMGTTLLGAYLSAAGVRWISVGDSPLWLYGKDGLRRLNEDHSLREVSKASGGSFGNLLHSAVNGQPIPLIDCRRDPAPITSDERLILGSDGILTLSEAEIAAIIYESAADPKAAVESLLREVVLRNERKQDNCTIVISRGLPVARRRFPTVPAAIIAVAFMVAAAIVYSYLKS
jgi:serine/threonine protein phosphatase PrpC